MNNLLDKLNLRPQEKRLIVVVASITFVVLNVWLVWPHFKDWRLVGLELDKAQETLRVYEKETARTGDYETRLRVLEGSGPNVIPEEQDLDLVRTVQSQTIASGLRVSRSDPKPKTSNSRTNQFFEEQTLSLRFEAGNEELVKFLVNLASTNSLIRVQDLDVHPDRGGFTLSGNITLIASYQKNQPLAPAESGTATNGPAAPPQANQTGRTPARASSPKDALAARAK